MTRCPGCGLTAPNSAAPVPPRYFASSGCWERYGRLLAQSFGDAEYRRVHQLVVDAYAVQHPRSETRDQVQQVALCLMTLALFVDDDVDVGRGPALHQRMAANLPPIHALDPPTTEVGMTVDDILDAESPDLHVTLVRDWASRLWRAWEPHHETVRGWNATALGD